MQAHDRFSHDARPSRLRLRALLEVEGVVDSGTVARFDEVLTGHVRCCVRELWVDLSELGSISPGGVAALMRADRELAADGRRLTVIGSRGAVRSGLELAGVAVHPDRHSAHRAG